MPVAAHDAVEAFILVSLPLKLSTKPFCNGLPCAICAIRHPDPAATSAGVRMVIFLWPLSLTTIPDARAAVRKSASSSRKHTFTLLKCTLAHAIIVPSRHSSCSSNGNQIERVGLASVCNQMSQVCAQDAAAHLGTGEHQRRQPATPRTTDSRLAAAGQA